MFLRGLLPLVVLVPACSACASEPTPARPDASVDASDDSAIDARVDATKPCTPNPRSTFVPDGWVPWDGYVPCSGFYVPTTASQLPPALTWETCAAAAKPQIVGCKSVVLDPNGMDSAAIDVSVDDNGKAVLLFSQDYKDRQLITVADADGGLVHSALLVAERSRYAVAAAIPKAFVYPRYVLHGVDMIGGVTDGVIVGTVGMVAPSAGRRWSRTVGHVIGNPGVAHIENSGSITLLSFADLAVAGDIITPTQSGPFGNSFPEFFGDSLYWFGNANRRALQRRWDNDTGPVDFIDYKDDDHGAGNLGTDGVDMVWMESHGPATQSALWTSADYWTSPYAKNKADLKPRRLRSEIPNTLAGKAIVVGCGRAANFSGNGFRIIDLKDGSSWFFPQQFDGWIWLTALALTCDEVFIRTASAKGPTITRIPIASLGPASPAD
ncbi:hypothetical protein BH09MYX1_BH09MYX1_01150 [soil metagenome]